MFKAVLAYLSSYKCRDDVRQMNRQINLRENSISNERGIASLVLIIIFFTEEGVKFVHEVPQQQD